MSDEARRKALAEALKDLGHDHELTRVTGAWRSAPDEWTKVTVREPGTLDPMDEWRDGWVVETEVTSL